MKELEVKKYDEKGNELAIRFGLGSIKAVGVGAMKNLVQIREKNKSFTDIYHLASNLGSKILNKKSVEALSKSGSLDLIHKNRKQIFESCEIICKFSSSQEEEKSSRSNNLQFYNLII